MTPEPEGRALAASRPERVCLGRIVGVHGVRGTVRMESYTARPEDIASYGVLTDAQAARAFTINVTGRVKGMLLARVEGVDDRTAAEALVGTALHVPRAALPPTGDEEYYRADLIGLGVETEDGAACGRVGAVHDHGAGDIVEIERPGGPSVLLPFTREHVPTVDLEGGRMVVSSRSLRAFGPPSGDRS